MTVRVRYMPNELGEGAVDLFPEADAWRELEDGSLALYEVWEDEDGKDHKRKVGIVRAGRWESAVEVVDSEDSEATPE